MSIFEWWLFISFIFGVAGNIVYAAHPALDKPLNNSLSYLVRAVLYAVYAYGIYNWTT